MAAAEPAPSPPPATDPGRVDRRAFGRRTAAAVAAGLAPSFLFADEPPAGPDAPAWTPPANPDPDVILREAARDARARRHAVALEKHVWFHEHALEYQPSQYGVRLSFALGYWKDLADDYPPALAALKAARDRAADDVKAADIKAPKADRRPGDKSLFNSFHDLEALNATLGEEAKTVELFRELDRTRPEAAREVARLVRGALIEREDYALAGKYLDPAELERRIEAHRQELNFAADPRFGPKMGETIKKLFLEEVATQLAILARTDRQAEAAELANRAKALRSDAAFGKAVDEAVGGKFPPSNRR